MTAIKLRVASLWFCLRSWKRTGKLACFSWICMLASVLACMWLEHAEWCQHPCFWSVAKNKDIKGNRKTGQHIIAVWVFYSAVILGLSLHSFSKWNCPSQSPLLERALDKLLIVLVTFVFVHVWNCFFVGQIPRCGNASLREFNKYCQNCPPDGCATYTSTCSESETNQSCAEFPRVFVRIQTSLKVYPPFSRQGIDP